MQPSNESLTPASVPAAAPAAKPEGVAVIGIDTFKKLDIRVGEILSAEKVPDTDKLLKLRVSFGAQERQIISGISAYFSEPEALVGKRVAFAFNLQPRTIRGLESQGMILAATGGDGSFALLEAPGAAPGARVG